MISFSTSGAGKGADTEAQRSRGGRVPLELIAELGED